MHQFSAIFFDLGGTLVYRIVTQERVLRLLCEEHQVTLPARPDWTGAVATWRAYHASHYLACRNAEDECDLLRQEARLVLDHLTGGAPPEMIERFVPSLQRASRWWGIYDDAMPVLNYLKTAGVKTGVISNWEASLPEFLRDMGLSHAFNLTVSSVEERIEKPSPRLFEIAMQRLGVSPSECLYVGDDYRADVVGARAAGMSPILLDRNDRYLVTDCLKISRLDKVIDAHQGHLHFPDAPVVCFSGYTL